MKIVAKAVYDSIQHEIHQIPLNEFLLSPDEAQSLRSKKIEQIVQKNLANQTEEIQRRVLAEINTWGPLTELLQDESITEIIVNGPQAIWLERAGRLFKHPDSFFSELSFRNCIDRLSHESNTHITKEFPSADGSFQDFRLSLIGSDITHSSVHLTLRRHPKNPWTFLKLAESGWCQERDLRLFQELVEKKKTF
ncbi:hypothetical protein [Bdellovibrio sp. ArHS]|uniref:hypothetical protein n=1 Tax=Bdellovibrio sp. ArHS TaxID=1569284 RepID=UPI000A614914|nr:hypothetical protein [Bdellovibrio sp. ArHS]